jgi:hypothetical protein
VSRKQVKSSVQIKTHPLRQKLSKIQQNHQ